MRFKKILVKKINWPADYALIFILTLAYYGWLQFNNYSQYIGDPDGFYHAKIALFLREGVLLKSLPWMQFSTLRDNFTDHHLLYHLLLTPFTYWGDPLTGVKIASVFFTASMITVFYWLLKKLNTIWPFAFALMFITLNGLNFRLGLIKANSLSLLLIWLLIYAVHRQKTWLLILLGFLFVWTYGGWPLAMFILLIYIITNKLYNRLHTNRLKIFWHKTIHIFKHGKQISRNLALVIYLAAGLALGLIINPYWPHNIYFYYQQIFQIGVVNMGSQFVVGAEWYGTTLFHIISASPHIFIIAALSFLILFFNYNKVRKITLFSFIMTFIFIILNIKSRRYIEYSLPFMLLFTACAISDLKNIISWKKTKQYWATTPRYIKIYLSVVLLVFAVVVMPKIYERILNVNMPRHWAMDTFQPALEWLGENTPENSLVMHNDWDQWPLLFYHNDHNYYFIGLDPTFMYNFDKEKHKSFTDLTTDKIE
ncbi:hypothetical protein K8R42_05475, partial [bacterium]|nr:hypothetical protein [bacterium]